MFRTVLKPVCWRVGDASLPGHDSGGVTICGTIFLSCCFCWTNGGEGGIRTPGTLARSTDFESAPFGHSGTSPCAGRTSRTKSRIVGNRQPRGNVRNIDESLAGLGIVVGFRKGGESRLEARIAILAASGLGLRAPVHEHRGRIAYRMRAGATSSSRSVQSVAPRAGGCASISTLVPGSTRSNRSMTSSLRMRIQPWEPGFVMSTSSGQPWM